MSTSNKITNNLFWRFAERTGAQFVTFVVQIVLARLLDPAAYGTVALITVFTTLLQVFVDSGLGNSLIQKKDADNIDFSTVFYTNIVFCFFLYLVLFFAAPALAAFYNDLYMIPYIRVLGITILISGLKNVQQAYVSRHMIFKKFFAATICGTLIAGIMGIVMALHGFGIWALVIQHVVNVSIDTVFLWFTVKWRPERVFDFERLKGLFSFGWKLLVSRLIDTIYNDLRQLIIGKNYSSSDLAYYNQGKKIPHLIITNINSSIDSVLFPAMSNVQEDHSHLKIMTRRSISTSVYIMAPLMIGLSAVAEPLINLILTEKWLPAIPFLRIFCISYLFYPIHTTNLNAIKAMGRSDLFLKLEILKKIIGLAAILLTMHINVKAMAYSLLATSFISQIINSWPNKKLLNYPYNEQMKDILPSILLSTGMGIIIYFINFLYLNDWLILILQIIIGAFIYITGSKLLHIDSFIYILSMAKHFKNKELH